MVTNYCLSWQYATVKEEFDDPKSRQPSSWLRQYCCWLYSWSIKFISQPEHWLPWVRFFVVFLCPSRQIQGLSFDTDYSSILHFFPMSLIIIGCTIQHYSVSCRLLDKPWDTKGSILFCMSIFHVSYPVPEMVPSNHCLLCYSLLQFISVVVACLLLVERTNGV